MFVEEEGRVEMNGSCYTILSINENYIDQLENESGIDFSQGKSFDQ